MCTRFCSDPPRMLMAVRLLGGKCLIHRSIVCGQIRYFEETGRDNNSKAKHRLHFLYL